MKKILIRTLISCAFLGLLYSMIRADLPQILEELRAVDRPLILLSFFIFLFTIAMVAKRLQIIFRAEKAVLSFRDCIQLSFVGYFFNNFLPTSVGGDIVKAMSAAKLTGQKSKSVTCVLVDRIFGLFTFVLIPSLTILLFWSNPSNPVHTNLFVPIIVYSLFCFSLLFFIIIFNRRIAKKILDLTSASHHPKWAQELRKVYDGLHYFQHHQSVMFQSMGISLAAQLVGILGIYVSALALGARLSPGFFFLLIPVIHLVSMIPSLNGLGIREGAYVYFLKDLLGKEQATAVGILWLGFLIAASVIGGLIYLFSHRYHVDLVPKKKVAATA